MSEAFGKDFNEVDEFRAKFTATRDSKWNHGCWVSVTVDVRLQVDKFLDQSIHLVFAFRGGSNGGSVGFILVEGVVVVPCFHFIVEGFDQEVVLSFAIGVTGGMDGRDITELYMSFQVGRGALKVKTKGTSLLVLSPWDVVDSSGNNLSLLQVRKVGNFLEGLLDPFLGLLGK